MLLQADSKDALDAVSSLGFFSFAFDKVKSSNTLVGVNCSPIAAGNVACDNKPVCCQDNSFNVSVVSALVSFSVLLTCISRAYLPLAARISYSPSSSNFPLSTLIDFSGPCRLFLYPCDENIISYTTPPLLCTRTCAFICILPYYFILNLLFR